MEKQKIAGKRGLLSFPLSAYCALVPHSPQNFTPGSSFVPHPVQNISFWSFAPHSGQNLTLLSGRGALHSGHEARTPFLQLSSFSISLSSSAIFECDQTSCTVRLACAAAISTAMSGAQSLQSPFELFQQLFLHTQDEQRGHWIKSGFSSFIASRNASS